MEADTIAPTKGLNPPQHQVAQGAAATLSPSPLLHLPPATERLDVPADMRARLDAVVRYLLPGAIRRGNKIVAGNVNGDKGDSFVMEGEGDKAGVHYDHETGEGGDLITLWGIRHSLDPKTQFPAIANSYKAWLGGYEAELARGAMPERLEISKEPAPDIGAPVRTWIYWNEDGTKELFRINRHEIKTADGKVKKTFRQRDMVKLIDRIPDTGRPLYNLHRIKDADTVLLAEGEKAADTLIELGYCGTCAMMGAKAPPEKTDLTPLKGKRVLIWPDNDKPGLDYAQTMADAILAAGATEVIILLPHEAWPQKEDAWDLLHRRGWTPDTIRNWIEVRAKRKLVRPKRPYPTLRDWSLTRYRGEAPVQQYLVSNILPMGVAGLLAAPGDTGKGVLMANMGLQIVGGSALQTVPGLRPQVLGGEVEQEGSVALYLGEDDYTEMHRRLNRLVPHHQRTRFEEKMFIVPMPANGGSKPFVVMRHGEPVESDFFKYVRDDLMSIPDLKMAAFDPLASFMPGDVNKDPGVCAFAMGLMAALAHDTGAYICLPHHMRKPTGNMRINSAETAREAIRGSSALVDGVRNAYALWPAEQGYQDRVFELLGEPFRPHAVFMGAVVKSNAPVDRTTRTYLRDANTGLLVDITARMMLSKPDPNDLRDMLVEAIQSAAADRTPFCHRGRQGVYAQRDRLPTELANIAKHPLEKMVEALLRENRIVKAANAGSTDKKWLDVPDGMFAAGTGRVEPTAAHFPPELDDEA